MRLRVMDMKVKLLYYLARDLMGATHFHFIRAYSAGLGEWVEALSFYLYQLCEVLFAPGPVRILNQGCELDMRETEILFFLAVGVMIRSRKTGNISLVAYLSSGFMCANMIPFFMADPRLGLVNTILFLLQGMMLHEPAYKGPENIFYSRGISLSEELNRDKNIVWMVN